MPGPRSPGQWSSARAVITTARSVLGQEWLDARVQQLEKTHRDVNDNHSREKLLERMRCRQHVDVRAHRSCQKSHGRPTRTLTRVHVSTARRS